MRPMFKLQMRTVANRAWNAYHREEDRRGHDPARLDGSRPRATFADDAMKGGKMAGPTTGHKARRATREPDSRTPGRTNSGFSGKTTFNVW